MRQRWQHKAGKTQSGANMPRVTIEIKTTPAPTPDTRGHPNRLWSNYLVNVSAEIYTPTGHKLEIARQLVPTASHVIEIQYRGLDPNIHRINYKGRVFAIGHTNDVDMMHVREILTCTEQKGNS
jgi:hypothetical protein